MHSLSLLRGWLLGNCHDIHRARIGALCRLVAGLLHRGTLTLTDLGRAMPGGIDTKYKIKCVDRLLGNRHLHRERSDIYRVMSSWLLRGVGRPVILVDWSDCTTGHKWLVLKAAVAVAGRAVSIYDEVHPLSRYNSPRVHRRFLRRLATVLPPGWAPVIVTDAGFRGPWFRDVESLGWHYVGRVRNRIRCCLDDRESWCWTTELYATASTVTRFLGAALLSHKRPYGTNLYLLRKPPRGPGRPPKLHGRGHRAKRGRAGYKEPWLLAISLPHGPCSLAEIPRLYALRMQIEETFRDLRGQAPRLRRGVRSHRQRRKARGAAAGRRARELRSVADRAGGEGEGMDGAVPGQHRAARGGPVGGVPGSRGIASTPLSTASLCRRPVRRPRRASTTHSTADAPSVNSWGSVSDEGQPRRRASADCCRQRPHHGYAPAA